MIILLIFSIITGLAVSWLSGIGALGWAVGIVLFVCGLPGALFISFISGEVSYTQDCADYRQYVSDAAAELRAEEHEHAEDERSDRLIKAVKETIPQVFMDNRQIHFHGRTG